MTYVVRGLEPAPFADLFVAGEATRRSHLAQIVTAVSDRGFPCRVSLEDARVGERLLLIHHVSHDIAGPFRMAHAIYVREGAESARTHRGELPKMLDSRTIGLRAFGVHGMMQRALIAQPGEGDAAVRDLFADAAIA